MAELTASSFIGKLSYSCKYPSCKNSFYVNIIRNGYTNKKFHIFPRNPVASQKWKSVCNINPTDQCKNFHICEDHFEKSDYNNPNELTRLSRDAVPHSPLKSNKRVSSFDNHDTSVNTQPRVLFPVNEDSLSAGRSLGEAGCSSEAVNSPRNSTEENQCNSVDNPPLILKGSTECSKMAGHQFDQFSFLSDTKKGILSKAGVSKKNLSPQEQLMYQEHRNVVSKLSRLRTILKNERAHLNSLKNLYNDGRFQFIEESLNDVSKDFINSQLRNVGRSPNGRRWTIRDKAFALSIYKRSPRLYRYLRAYFQLPSIKILKDVLAMIPFECGMIEPVLEHLKLQVDTMDELDRCCTLIFDEISLSRGFDYNSRQQKVYGFED